MVLSLSLLLMHSPEALAAVFLFGSPLEDLHTSLLQGARDGVRVVLAGAGSCCGIQKSPAVVALLFSRRVEAETAGFAGEGGR